MIVPIALSDWLLNHALDGILSSVIGGVIGAWVVVYATRAGRDQWRQDRSDRNRGDRQRALDEFRSELGSVYLAVEQEVTGHITQRTNDERAPTLAHLSARLTLLQLSAERGRPAVEGDVSRLSILMDEAIRKDREGMPIFTSRMPPQVKEVRDGLLNLLRASIEWTVD